MIGDEWASAIARREWLDGVMTGAVLGALFVVLVLACLLSAAMGEEKP